MPFSEIIRILIEILFAVKRGKRMAKKILMVVGSFREKSFNRQLAHTIESVIGGRADVSFLEYADVPFMNQDAEVPEPLTKTFRQHQGRDYVWRME